MTSEEFWKDDPKLFSSYQKSYVDKLKRNNEVINYSNWLQGLYIYDGLQKSLTTFGYNFIVGKNNDKNEQYPAKPYDLFGENKNKDKQEKERVRKQSQNSLNYWARLKK